VEDNPFAVATTTPTTYVSIDDWIRCLNWVNALILCPAMVTYSVGEIACDIIERGVSSSIYGYQLLYSLTAWTLVIVHLRFFRQK
jgi:hypothetical protein